MFYSQLKERFSLLAHQYSLLQEDVAITARILKNEEAIGNPTRRDYPLLKGKEFLMEARFGDCRGQAFTDAPGEKKAALAEIIALPLDRSRNRALFIAALNAVMRYLRPEIVTVHCHDDEPEDCAGKIIRQLQQQSVHSIGLVGLQPAILEALTETFGADNISCVDRDESRRGETKYGVPIQWGDERETAALFKRSAVVLATGSTVVNGTLPGLLELGERLRRPIFFYGTALPEQRN